MLNKTGVHMTTFEIRQKARELFKTYDAPPQVIKQYQRKWVRSVMQLGPNWLLAQPVSKTQ
jgi:hypothetical protein